MQYNTIYLILGAVIHHKQWDRDAVLYLLDFLSHPNSFFFQSFHFFQTRLDKYAEEFTRLDARVTEVDHQLSQISQPQSPQAPRSSPGGDTIAVGAELLQQAFVNFKRHIYRLEETWRQQTLEHNGTTPLITLPDCSRSTYTSRLTKTLIRL
jgi:hypothetical protein